MTLKDRQQAALQELNSALVGIEQKYGLHFVTELQAESFNPTVCQLKAVTYFAPLPNWTPPEESPAAEKEKTNGHQA